MKTYASIDEYIATFPKDVQVILEKVRQTIKKVSPQLEEALAYGIPTFKLKGNVVHFGGYAKHIGFYPAPRGIEAFKKDLVGYEGGKGTVQFPLDKPIPYDLIAKITQFRVNEQLAKSK